MSWISLPLLFHSGCFLLRAKKKTFAVYVLPTTCFLSSLLCVISAVITLNPEGTQTFSFFLFLAHRNVHEHSHLKTLWLNQTFPQFFNNDHMATVLSICNFKRLLRFICCFDNGQFIWYLSDFFTFCVSSIHLNLYLHFLALLKKNSLQNIKPGGVCNFLQANTRIIV